jgi:hypothetical protein
MISSKNTSDDVFENEFMSLNWLSVSRFVDVEKIRGHLPSFKYFITEEKLLSNYCTEKVFNHVVSKKNLFESKNAKNLGRSGVPCKYIREFLLKLFMISNPEESFKSKFQLVFKERDPNFLEDFVPYFTGYSTLKESLNVDFLNADGIQKMKEILWLLNSAIPSIEFSPIIIKLTSFILLFCTPGETYEIMKVLLEMNYNLSETYKIRWHLRFSYNDNLKIISSITEAIREISVKSGRETFLFFESKNFPPEKLYEDMIYGLFFDYLNFEGICRLVPFFMMEGVKSLYRLVYALLKTLKTDILQIQYADEIIPTIRKKAKSISDIKKLFEIAYTFKLTRHNNKYDFQKLPDKDLFAGKRNSFYLPSFNVASYILKESEVIKMWSKLPINLRIKDAKMIFNTQTHGYSLTNIYTNSEYCGPQAETLFLIETLDGDVFGGFMSKEFKHTNNSYERPMQSLLFKIRPDVKVYEPSKTTDDVVYCDTSCFMFGGGPDGPAIRFDKDLNNGFSHPNNCFSAPVLVKNENGEFKIKKMEIFILG